MEKEKVPQKHIPKYFIPMLFYRAYLFADVNIMHAGSLKASHKLVKAQIW